MAKLLHLTLVLLCFHAPPAQAGQTLPGPYQAIVTEVIDGDTVRARIQIWLGQEIETLIRIEGIDSPEIKSRCEKEHTLALQAQRQLQNIIGDNMVYLHNIKFGKYAGRILARIHTKAGLDITDILLSQNVARNYEGGKRSDWC